ncbi:cytochrome ubiquinol oxidase subunit I, partial [uncultured Bifidobacterium sp.]
MTTIFHFFYVPMTIGLALAVAIMETTYVVTKKDVYKKMTMFWSKIFLLSFAVGVVTGIIQEFQFGMNWSNYSRFMGDIFGAPLAIEALLAFFLESTFIGVWMFTWNRFKPAVHAVFIWLTFLGSSMSAIWILAANSFMQHPVGFEINQATGHVRLRSFGDVMSNPQLWIEFPHVFFAAVCTGAFVVMGCSAFSLLRMHMGNKDKAVAAVEADSEKQAKVNLFTKS